MAHHRQEIRAGPRRDRQRGRRHRPPTTSSSTSRSSTTSTSTRCRWSRSSWPPRRSSACAIPDDEVKNLKTVGDAVAFIEQAPGLTQPSARSASPRGPSATLDRTAPHVPSHKELQDPMSRATRRRHRTRATTTPSAATSPSTWDALLAGRSGVRAPHRGLGRAYELPVTIAGTHRRRARPRCSTGSRPAGSTAPPSSR